MTIFVPALFFIGLENVHSEGLPKEGSQAGLITVKPTTENSQWKVRVGN